MTEQAYEYKKVYSGEIDKHLAEGWEPVPHVEPVVTYQFARPTVYVFLRRPKDA